MIIRLGYACKTETLPITTSSTYTYTNFLKEKDLDKLDKIIINNLNNLEKIIKYNIKNNIHFYRLSSNIIPLATKKEVEFEYVNKYKDIYQVISKLINDFDMRVDFHPNEYCVLNSVKKEVVSTSIDILKYHYQLLKAFNIQDKVLILHVGSNTFGKENSIKRFINKYNDLPPEIKKCIVIENDDKIFNIEDCLYISNILNIPVCLDYHHYICNPSKLDYQQIIDSFHGRRVKMHFSSPKNKTKKDFRTHNDYINSDDFINFIQKLREYNTDIDIMLEAKKKDEALSRLVRELKYKTDYKFIDETTFIL